LINDSQYGKYYLLLCCFYAARKNITTTKNPPHSLNCCFFSFPSPFYGEGQDEGCVAMEICLDKVNTGRSPHLTSPHRGEGQAFFFAQLLSLGYGTSFLLPGREKGRMRVCVDMEI
jgi:hypothetical protein